MTTAEIDLVKQTWEEISPISLELGQRFYTVLFERAPAMKALFKNDLRDQVMKLMFMVSYFVNRLEQDDLLKEEVHKVAARHTDYGATPADYAIMGDVLVEVFAEDMAATWTQAKSDAWRKAYDKLAALMLEASPAAQG